MKTLAAVLTKVGQPLELRELTVPPLKDGQVLVRIKAAGVCRTQLNEQQGIKGEDPYLPHLLGHEASGVVEDVGEGVSKVCKGDTVIVSWIKGSGANVPGGQYIDEEGKIVNSGPAAVFTMYAVVSENRVMLIDSDVPVEVAGILGCAVATGVGAVRNNIDKNFNGSLAVFGVGGIGSAAIIGARAIGVKNIIAADIRENKLAFARKLGANKVVNTADLRTDFSAMFEEIAPDGFDVALEASGNPNAAECAFAALSKTGKLVIAGHPTQGSVVRFNPFGFIEGRSVVGTWGGGTVPDRDFPMFMEWYKSGKLPINELIGDIYPFTCINEAMAALKSGALGRIVLSFE